MKLIEWSEVSNVNIKPIDDQHQQMAKTVNELYSLLGSRKYEALKFLLKKLLDDTRQHFSMEEEMMKYGKFQSYISHKLEHDRFENEIKIFYRKYTKGEADVNLEFLIRIKKWLFNHIEINDKKLGAYINSLKNREEFLTHFEIN